MKEALASPKDAALKLALEALEHWDNWSDHTPPKTIEAITAIKAALAQPAQQEPVAWMDIDEKGGASGLRYWSEPDNRHEVALYTTPQQRPWVGLTDEDFYGQSELQRLAMKYAETKLKWKNK
jgi:hypothetical protein